VSEKLLIVMVAMDKKPTDVDEATAWLGIERFGGRLLKAYLAQRAERAGELPPGSEQVVLEAFMSGFGSGILRTIGDLDAAMEQLRLRKPSVAFGSPEGAVQPIDSPADLFWKVSEQP
jgi:hypothetical protein